MPPIVDAKLWSRWTNRKQFLVRERASGRTSLAGTLALGDRNAIREQNPCSSSSWTGTAFALVLLSAMVTILYARVLVPWAQQLWGDPNYGHGLLVPVFSGYLLWRERKRWRASPLQTSDWGLPIMLCAIGLLILGTLGAEHFTARVSLLILISGMIVFLAGWKALRSIAFPIAYLVFMIPLPAIVYYQLTFPLQLWASRLGAGGLVVLGVHAIREGNLLILPNCTLDVVEACSGIRSLLSLLAAAVGYLYLAERSTWKRCMLVALTIPAAIVTNGFRLVSAGLLSFVFGPEVDSGTFHSVLGLTFLALAFLSILLVHRSLLPQGQRTTPQLS